MCLIAIAHRVSPRFPLVIAANRDEAYDRATHDAHFWPDAPDVLGGRDGVHGGTWLAVTRGGRFAAVTNLRGAEQRTRSRGALVAEFVTSEIDLPSYASGIARDAAEYSGFHLLAGEIDGRAMYISPETQYDLEPGIHGVSNAPSGEHWPKVGLAVATMGAILESPEEHTVIDDLMRFLSTQRGAGTVESEVFITGEIYGTRSSTVIVATRNEILFAEQSYARGGDSHGSRREYRIARGEKVARSAG
jgi:uncharacterized protein with NRDE domain